MSGIIFNSDFDTKPQQQICFRCLELEKITFEKKIVHYYGMIKNNNAF